LLEKAVKEGVEQLVIFEDDMLNIKFVKRTKLWLPRPPGDAVLCYLGFTYKDDLTDNRPERGRY
jgi:hypothetical protein